jgi:hypothetical protein
MLIYLFHIKNLDTVTGQLATDEHVILVATNLMPDRVVSDWGV